jgi:membrane associated rhomboid family serine protease
MQPDAAAALTLARSLHWGGEVDRAIEEYDRSIAAWPGDAALRAGRAGARAQRGDAEGAREDVKDALGLDPRCAEAWYVSARLKGSEEAAAAVADAGRALESDPDHMGALYWRAGWRGAAGDGKGMREDLERAAVSTRTDALSLFYRAVALLSLGRMEAAVVVLNASIEAGLGLPFAYVARAEVRALRRDHRGAVEDYGRAIEKAPGQASLWVQRGRERLRAGDGAGASDDFQRALALHPRYAAAFYYRAFARSATDRQGSREDYERAAAIEPADAEGYYYRGLALESLRRRREAARDFEEAFRRAPPTHPRRQEIAERYERTRRRSLREILRQSPVTCLIAAANLAVWVAQGDLFKTPGAEKLLAWGALERSHVLDGEYWRLLTAVFLHVGPFHVLWNSYWSIPLCGAVERVFGSWRFLLAYLLTGIGASAVSLLGHRVVSAGASGALFGMLGVVVFLGSHRMGSCRAFLGHPRVLRGLAIVGFFFLLGIFLPFDNYAHLGGMLFGLLIGWLYLKVPSFNRIQKAVSWAAALLLLAGTAAAACIPWLPEGKTDLVVRRAARLYERNDLKGAVSLLDAGIGRDPCAGILYLLRADVRRSLGDVEAALADARRALELLPPGSPLRKAAEKLIEDLGRRP